MGYKDGQFSCHPWWRFLIFNILIRRKSAKSAQYYMSKVSNMASLNREELGDALNPDPNLLLQIVHQGSSLTGTHPFWGAPLQA
jgi:hypothetical protein